MPILRLAYTTLFLIALIAVFVIWGQVGGQGHLEIMPWYLKLVLGFGVAFAVVKATMAAVSGDQTWNAGTLKWVGILLGLLLLCGVSTYYFHLYGESDEGDEQDAGSISLLAPGGVGPGRGNLYRFGASDSSFPVYPITQSGRAQRFGNNSLSSC